MKFYIYKFLQKFWKVNVFTFLHMTAGGTRARFLKLRAYITGWHFILIFDLIQISIIKAGSDVHREEKIKTRVILEINIELTRLDTYKKVSLGFYLLTCQSNSKTCN